MKRKIVKIDEAKCNGCGLCAEACHEGAIAMEGGKARLIRDDYCDGLGACLPHCPADAITIEEREAAPFDEEAVKARMAHHGHEHHEHHEHHEPHGHERHEHHGHEHHHEHHPHDGPHPFACPGAMARAIERRDEPRHPAPHAPHAAQSELRQWPVQIKLVPPQAPYFNGAKLLVAADCTAYAYAAMHERFMRGRVTLIGCPKLDMVDYTEKLTAIIANNEIRSVDVVRMEVPCCGGIEMAVRGALSASGKMIPWQVTVISTDGEIVDD